ncbi:hypothetical protein [Exiguobacterium sp. s78]|uniref:hypothetical protein n=1 Tax=Exiguobacterium sp. s78 TaxID=2751197 RepID=UPI001BE55805|nr:hypothetical protein [Exiguobacterium sp. s78]
MFEVNEKSWFSNQNNDSYDQLSGFEHDVIMSHTQQTMAEVIAMSPETKSVSVQRYENGIPTNFTTQVIIQSQKTMYDKNILSVLGQIYIGDLLSCNGKQYLVTSPARENIFYEAHFARLVTATIEVETITKVDTGKKTSMGAPIYIEERVMKSIPIAFHAYDKESGEDTSMYAPINSPESQLRFMIQFMQGAGITKNLSEFKFMSVTYVVTYLDHTNTEFGQRGIVTVEAKRKA